MAKHEFEPKKDIDLDYKADNEVDPQAVPRLEEIVGDLIRVSTTPTYTPRNFKEALALDTSDNIIYYYDFDNNQWRSVNTYALTDDLTQNQIDAITNATGPTSANPFATEAQLLTQISLTAGENITQDDAVVIGQAATSATVSVDASGLTENLTTGDVESGDNLWAQSFTTTVTTPYVNRVDLNMGWGGTGTWTFTMGIQAMSGGNPSGTNLQETTASVTESVGADTAVVTFTFSTPVQLSSSTEYAIVVNTSNTTNDPYWEYSNGFGYSGGNQFRKSSGTWSEPNGSANDFGFFVYESSTTPGRVFKADASNNDSRANNFIGFAESAITSGVEGVITVGPVINFLSGLTQGATYYLSDTAGSISTSAGSQSRKIGIALSTTELLIKHDNV